MNTEELKIICDTVVKLTEVKIQKVEHLCVENFAADCFAKLLGEYSMHKKGFVKFSGNTEQRH